MPEADLMVSITLSTKGTTLALLLGPSLAAIFYAIARRIGHNVRKKRSSNIS
jgi:hypothetical protein